MSASTKKKEINLDQKNLNFNITQFKGKFSFIYNTLKILLVLSFTESPDIRNIEDKIKEINTLFTQNEKNDLKKALFSFIIMTLPKSLHNQLPKDGFGIKALVAFTKFYNNKIELEQLSEKLIELLKEAILLVQKNGSKSISIKIIDEFWDYITNYSKQLDRVKKELSSTKEEETKVQSEIDYENIIKKLKNDIMVLKNEIKKKEKDLESANTKIVQASLDKGTYIDINRSLENKIKEMERKFELKFGKMDNEIESLKNENTELKIEVTSLKNENTELRNEISSLKNVNAELKNEFTELKNENNSLFEMVRQEREMIWILKDYIYKIDKDYDFLNNFVHELNDSLQQIIPYLVNFENFNPFNINFFK